MTGLLGISALQVALAVALFASVALFTAGARRSATARALGYGGLYTSAGLVAVSTAAMIVALVTHDFSVSYVAQVGSRETPLFFTIISLWSALEGSILFWAFLLFGYVTLVAWIYRRARGPALDYAAATLLAIGVFFLVLLVGPANPFHAVFPPPADGPGPNPLLQNHPLMAVHPPLLYLGYVGFSVPFAFAVGAMLAGDAGGDAWITRARLWTVAAWLFLTGAIIAGMWWSYAVLGWGGYWAWDPVENASLMPWLTATAFMHSIMVQTRRGMLRVWNLNLVVATFVLTVLGTFLTRSGILSSVHAFTEGTIGYYFLAFIGVVLIASLVLVAGHAPELRTRGQLDDPLSRETAFLVGNLLFSVVTFTILFGTLFPLLAEAARGVRVSVGGPFFDRMTLPLIVTILFLVGVGPALPWRRTDRAWFLREMRLPLGALAVVLAVCLVAGVRDLYALLAFAFGAFAITTNLEQLALPAIARMRAHGERAFVAFARAVASDRHRAGGYVAHLGILVAAIGIAGSSAFKREREVTLRPHESVTVAGQTVRLDLVWGRQEAGRTAVGADLSLLHGASVVAHLDPEQRFYDSSDEPVPTPSVKSSLTRDVYVNLMAFAQDGSTATLHVLVEPLVGWIWFGGLLACCGALIGLWPRRRREVAPATAAAPAATKTPGAAPRRTARAGRRPAGVVS